MKMLDKIENFLISLFQKPLIFTVLFAVLITGVSLYSGYKEDKLKLDAVNICQETIIKNEPGAACHPKARMEPMPNSENMICKCP